MERREVVRLLTTAAVWSVFPQELLTLCRSVHAQLAPSAALRTLDAHQNATVTVITELIIPTTDTPGARAARVSEFIDWMLADWYPEEDRARFLTGLADVDARSRALFGKDFVDCAENQQVEILMALDAELARARVAILPGSSGLRGEPAAPEQNFFYMMKRLTLVGYFTSEIGATQELHFQIIPTQYDSCVALEDWRRNATS